MENFKSLFSKVEKITFTDWKVDKFGCLRFNAFDDQPKFSLKYTDFDLEKSLPRFLYTKQKTYAAWDSKLLIFSYISTSSVLILFLKEN